MSGRDATGVQGGGLHNLARVSRYLEPMLIPVAAGVWLHVLATVAGGA